MTSWRQNKREPRFARKALRGPGVGIDEAVAAAEAQIEQMRDSVREQIGAIIGRLQGARTAADDSPHALGLIRAEADALVGLCRLFGMPEIEAAALSLCELYDACQPDWPIAEGIDVHLAAVQLFWSLPPDAAGRCSAQVMDGLRQAAAAMRRRSSHKGCGS